MAKGNDGNLLQHGIECELTLRLHEGKPDRGLQVVLTHGMEPFEPFEPRDPNPGAYQQLSRWLDFARTTIPLGSTPAVVRAYRSSGASSTAYPNTAELLSEIVGRDKLSGVITDIEPSKAASLRQVWYGSNLQVLEGSWRNFLHEYRCPAGLDTPWLFSMDPMNYTNQPFADDNRLREPDLLFLRPVLETYFATKMPGAVCLFCFSLQPHIRKLFKEDVKSVLADELGGLDLGFFEFVARGGNRHVGAVLTKQDLLLAAIERIVAML